MKVLLPNPLNLNKFASFGAKKSAETVKESTLEKSPKSDVVVLSQSAKRVKAVKPVMFSLSYYDKLIADYNKVVEANILGKELTSIIFADVDLNKAKPFSEQQERIIKLASKRIDFFKEQAQSLEKDAKTYLPEIMKITQDAFGGTDAVGKYLCSREKNGVPCPKDAVSIYNKMVKEFKDAYLKGNVLDGLSIPNYNKPYKFLDKDEQNLLKMYAMDNNIAHNIDYVALEAALKITNKSRTEATNWIRDLVGLRLIIPDTTSMKEVEKYLTDAATTGKLNITKISNYHSSHIYPYIKNDTLKFLQENIPGLYVVRSSDVRKKNGYTTTQMNISFPFPDKKDKNKIKFINCELQIRSATLNKLGQIEHLIYDILENKNIYKNIPELKQFYDSIGIVKAVNEVFNDSKKENAYLEYEKTTYQRIRDYEKKRREGKSAVLEYPLLADFGLGEYEVLSFQFLEQIENTANQIKKKYKIKN